MFVACLLDKLYTYIHHLQLFHVFFLENMDERLRNGGRESSPDNMMDEDERYVKYFFDILVVLLLFKFINKTSH